MDYEKKYNEALERAKKMTSDLTNLQAIREFIFPELRESEDERIRKKLIKTIGYFRSRGIDQQLCEEFRAYLEKQEQKPVEWSDKDRNTFNLALDLIKHSDDCDGLLDKDLAVKWFAELPSRFIPQPKQEWNTHDKAAVNCIVRCLDGQFVSEAARKQCLEWFNKHRRDFLNSPSWKPSEEQMEALENSTALTEEQGMALYSLIQDLKKLYYDRREN